MFGPLGPSLAPTIKANRGLYKIIKPFAGWYADLMGYRRMGLKYDDLLVEERPDVQRALGRLTDKEQYDRTFRFRRASQASILHADLPKSQWLKPEEDTRYLTPHVESVVEEDSERQVWDTLAVERKK
ncbi:ubiquinol-cytochrome-c reductase complex subunit 6 [Irpex rosettiformis]|uniref:Ubiquinol-cytochrome-c reductase complex subunit 6 n=1 Tax=Irpex rosettiformis TaxID=378272 RepID=A0ACB8TU26_9APHY|nr:ubiquinol-cytochrome-c reductase complex subunit 6 [Irpex rosettiformis]